MKFRVIIAMAILPLLATATENQEYVILLHGFGSNGADLLGVAEFWRDALPRVATVGPNAPERAGLGFQWFSLAGISEANRPARIAAAREQKARRA